MVTSEKLAGRMYPGLQELYLRLQKLAQNISPVSDISRQTSLSQRTRNILYSSPFDCPMSPLKFWSNCTSTCGVIRGGSCKLRRRSGDLRPCEGERKGRVQ